MLSFLPSFVLIPLVYAVILLAPGYAWFEIFPARRGGLANLADAVGISISLAAVLAVFAFWFNLHFNAQSVGALYIVCVTIWGVGRIYHLRGKPLQPACAYRPVPVWATLAGLLVLAGLIAWRFFQARGLLFPAWVDSVHHTLIVNQILSTGGLPSDLSPLLPVTFFYHFTFHLFSAIFSLLTGAEITASVLWTGQLLNALVALSIYRLGLVLFDDWKRAGAAALLTGFVLEMPAFYLNWGRYTLLAGLVLLPLAMAGALDLFRKPEGAAPIRWREGFYLAVLVAGLSLSHYMAFVLYVLFLGLLSLPGLLDGLNHNRWKEFPLRSIAMTLLGMLLAARWLYRAWRFTRRYAGVDLIAPQNITVAGLSQSLVELIGPLRGWLLLGIALVALVFVLRRKDLRAFALWFAAMLFLTLPFGLRLDPFRPDHLAIVLFVPVALLAADLLFRAGEWLAARWKPAGWAVPSLALTALLAWGILQTANIQSPSTVLITTADLPAMDWIERNTPPEARFFINSTLWQTASYRGVDGGYWLGVLTGRFQITPPAMYGYGSREYRAQVNDWSLRAGELTTCSPEFWQLVSDAGIQYLYITEGRGSLQPEGLTGCRDVVQVYQRNGVHLYQIAGTGEPPAEDAPVEP